MRLATVPVDTIAANIDFIFDPRVGIVGEVAELPREPGAPDFIHIRARGCDTGAFVAQRNRRAAECAAIDRGRAIASAVADVLTNYCAALYERDGLPLASVAEADFACVKPADFALHSEAQYRRPGFPFLPPAEDLPLRWAATTDLATGETMHVPAAFVWHPYVYFRGGGDLPIAEPCTAGLACHQGVAAAALAGLADVVTRDALAIFWQAMIVPPLLDVESLPAPVLELVRRFQATGDRVVILDVAVEHRLPTFVAVVRSDVPERPAFVFAAATDLDPARAIASALEKLAANQRLSRRIMRTFRPASPQNEWEDVVDWLDHLDFAADHANRDHFTFAFSSEDRRRFGGYENLATGTTETDLEVFAKRIVASGHRAYAANLTSDDIGVLGLNVCRVLVPGFHPLFAGHRQRALGGDRLYDVPRRLGYRGIARGTGGNPAPHPFV
jgi:ribosomal protein S12 methylthiotransferase accessory factor